MKNLLVVVTAKLVADEMKGIMGNIPPVLLPYDSKTLLQGICENNQNHFDIQVLGNEKINLIEEHVTENKLNAKVLKTSVLGSIKDTFAETKYENYENVTFLLGDTIVKGWDLHEYVGNKIAYAPVEDPEKWTTFTNEETLEIFDKEEREFADQYNAFVGIYSFANPKKLFSIIEKANNLYDAIKIYNESEKLEFVEEKNWIDLGHLQEFQENQHEDVASRFFNEIKIDRERGILEKRSTEKEKFTNEIKWYLKMPKDLEYLTPRVFDYSTSYNDLFIAMEYYSYPTLHNIFVYGKYSIQKWDKILNLLLKTNDEFRKYKLNLPKDEIDSALRKIYLDKTIDRLNNLREDETFTPFFTNKITINGKVYPSLNEIMDQLPNIIDGNLLNIDELSVIHGDYFFANILYDGTSNFIRLIDPRGDFGGFGIYGDPRYDMAKLSHSLNGKYDFIVTDKFEVNQTNTEINYKINVSSDHEKIKDLFLEKLNENKSEIELIESLLFISMVPLHSDYPERQKVMLATGIEQISKFLDGEV